MDRLSQFILPLALLWAAGAFPWTLRSATSQEQNHPPGKSYISVDEDVLRAFVDEPRHRFEAARNHFLAGRQSMAAREIQVAAAYLQLESARATACAHAALGTSIRELQQLAAAIERGEFQTFETLQQAFSRAHFALAEHHCAKCSACVHQCCDSGTGTMPLDAVRNGFDLKAAADHLRQGSLWSGGGIDDGTQAAIQASQLTAGKLIGQAEFPESDLARSLDALHGNLERLTGRKIMLAPSVVEDDKLAPAIFR